MTSTVKITSHNYPVKVTIRDQYGDRDATEGEDILWPEDGERTYHTTTSRTITAVDVDFYHIAAVNDRIKRYPGVTMSNGHVFGEEGEPPQPVEGQSTGLIEGDTAT